MSIEPAGRKLLRIEARNSQTPIERKPEWIKTRANMGPEYTCLLYTPTLPTNLPVLNLGVADLPIKKTNVLRQYR